MKESACHNHTAPFRMLLALLAAFLLLPSQGLIAQESMSEISAIKSKSSSIRALAGGGWLVCCKDTLCRFLRVYPGNTSVDVMVLDSHIVSVTDFKIHQGAVYFCGMTSSNVPYMARILLSTFPTTFFEWEYLSLASKVNKLEVYGSSDYVVHVVMTGQDLSDYGILIEAMSMQMGWNVSYTKIYATKGEYYIFNDIAISDTLAAVTVYEKKDPRDSIFILYPSKARVWFLRVPISGYDPLVSSTPYYVNMPYDVYPPFAVREAEPNTFVTAATGCVNFPISNVYVSSFIGKNHYATATLPPTYTFKNISYNPDAGATEVLVKDILGNHDIFTLLPGMATTPGLAYGHRFNNYVLNSLDYQSFNPNHFVCVGYPTGATYPVSIATFHSNYTIQCSKQVNENTGILEWSSGVKKGWKQIDNEILAATGIHATTDRKDISTLCFKRYTIDK